MHPAASIVFLCTEAEVRKAIWRLICLKVPEGSLLPWWALTARAALYPLDFLFWRMSKTRGYQWATDTWLIEGVTYSGEALRLFAEANGEAYRVTRVGETVMLERIPAAADVQPKELHR
jgi:hypothetical protein